MSTTTTTSPLIAVCMGSDTDLATLKPGLTILEQSGVAFEVRITSAHRTPMMMMDFARNAAGRGLKVIIAAAGSAAHLPGMLASETTLPVIGVPVKATHLDGQDSLYSIVQMPRGVPVLTVGIGNSTNAAIGALRILGTADQKWSRWVADHLKRMEEENLEKDRKLVEQGWKAYQREDSRHYQSHS